MAERKDDFRRALVTKIFSYALGRGIQPYDRPSIDAICTAVKADGDRFSSIVAAVAKSYPFQHARGMKGQMPEDTAATTWYDPVPDKPLVAPPTDPTATRGPAGKTAAAGTPSTSGPTPATATSGTVVKKQ
jgi:hypothetical protein